MRARTSDLSLGKSSLELSLSEPVVEGGLSLVLSNSVAKCSTHKVYLNWFVDYSIDNNLLYASGHFVKIKLIIKHLLFIDEVY